MTFHTLAFLGVTLSIFIVTSTVCGKLVTGCISRSTVRRKAGDGSGAAGASGLELFLRMDHLITTKGAEINSEISQFHA